ncbi:hypothetical protein [Vibrio barjaei]|uniref:hypothetical protein n=1 Tax=Vibrio barjaei TaxID=1676683 RepID=UPI0022835DDD|nr:hypothetical protein [Vibrio barjaei]MCY9873208.1 hypothetical protein [Vibrio barjaei]
MNTKLILLSRVIRAELATNQQLTALFTLLRKAVEKYESDEIDWHLVNGLTDFDILFLIVMTDTDLTVNFDATVLAAAVNFVVQLPWVEREPVYH